MAYITTSHPGSMPGYTLYHTPFPTTTESLKQKRRSIVVSEVELPPDAPDKSSISRSLLSPTLNLDPDRRSVPYPSQNDPFEPGQDQGQLALLTSINEQTTSLLSSYSKLDPQNGQSREKDTSLLEQVLILGQIAIVLASSLPTALTASEDSSVGWPLDTLQVQAQAKGENHTLGVQVQVAVALTNMGTALVKQFDRTGDRRDLEEAGGLYGRVLVVGRGRRLRVERGKTRGIGKGKRKWDLGRQEDEGDGGGEEEYGDGDERGEVFVRLEKLEELLGERGFVV